MRSSMSEAHKPTSLPIEQPPRSLRACRIRRRVGSAIACNMRFSACSGLFMEDSNRTEIERCQCWASDVGPQGGEGRTAWRSKGAVEVVFQKSEYRSKNAVNQGFLLLNSYLCILTFSRLGCSRH